MQNLVLVLDNVRSALNVGSLFRTAEGLGISQVILTGYTPYPVAKEDKRLPHIAKKVDARIQKTALGAEKSVKWKHFDSIDDTLSELRLAGFEIAALEQATQSVALRDYRPPSKLALIVGSEVGGIDQAVLKQADVILEIPMLGKKESFNVAAAGAMALYHLSNLDRQSL